MNLEEMKARAAATDIPALVAEVERLRSVIDAMLSTADGCSDYGGGHHGSHYEAFQDGVATVANVLRKRVGDDYGASFAGGPVDYQTAVVESVGRQMRADAAEVERLRGEVERAEIRRDAAICGRDLMAVRLENQNAGLVTMARERDALKVEVERLKARTGRICDCVTAVFERADIGKDRMRAGLMAYERCSDCHGSGAVIMEGDA